MKTYDKEVHVVALSLAINRNGNSRINKRLKKLGLPQFKLSTDKGQIAFDLFFSQNYIGIMMEDELDEALSYLTFLKGADKPFVVEDHYGNLQLALNHSVNIMSIDFSVYTYYDFDLIESIPRLKFYSSFDEYWKATQDGSYINIMDSHTELKNPISWGNNPTTITKIRTDITVDEFFKFFAGRIG